MSAVVAPYGTLEDPFAGWRRAPDWLDRPNWAVATLGGGHHGRAHTRAITASKLQGGGALARWFTEPAELDALADARWRDRSPAQETPAIAEPCIMSAGAAYYARHSTVNGGYRRHTAAAAPPRAVEPRAGGKLCTLPPRPASEQGAAFGMRQFPAQRLAQSGVMQEPQIVRLGRPPGKGRHVETGAAGEVPFEKTLHRKGKVTLDMYRGSGRAGDLSVHFSPEPRVEDSPHYRHKEVDSQAYLRFVRGLPPPPAASPHQRRQQQLAQRSCSERCASVSEVRSLEAWEEGVHGRRGTADMPGAVGEKRASDKGTGGKRPGTAAKK